MSKLGTSLVDTLTGGRGTRPMPGTLRELADELWRTAGNQRRAAQLAGVDRRTFQRWYQRWNAGTAPARVRPGTLDKLGAGLRAARLDPGRPDDRSFDITVKDRTPHARDRGQPRTRTLNGASNLRLAPGTMDRLADVWTRTGDPEAVAATFLQGVTVPFYKRWLAPAPGDRAAPPSSSAAPSSPAAPGGDDEGDDEGPGGDEEEFYDQAPEDAYDEFYDDLYGEGEEHDIPDSYGADPA